ncbi:MAG: PHP domain-containing protein [Bacilli bacterium]
MGNYIDLHCHSSFSDGHLTVKEIITNAKENGVKGLSITDHDDIRSIKEVKNLKENDIIIVAGTEFSTTLNFKGKVYYMHLLGYGFDESHSRIVKMIQHYLDNRFINNITFFDKIQEFGIEIPECLFKEVKLENYNLIIKEMVLALYKNNYSEEYIATFLKKIKPFTPDYEGYEVDTIEAINAINEAGGIAVVPHLQQIEATDSELIEIINYLSKNRVRGIEVFHSETTGEQMKRYHDLSEEFNILVSVGSDFHCFGEDNKVIGHGIDDNLCITQCSLFDYLIDQNLIINKNIEKRRLNSE